ncbi:hypothetical protein REPUB_Repub14bG0010700 [Reevesia pubescens]
MILRTPPPKKQRAEPFVHDSPSAVPASEGRLVIYEDTPAALPPATESPHHQPSDHLLCTYQCRQMPDTILIFTEAERKKYRYQFLYAEQELAAAKGREQMLHDQLLKEVNDSQERFKKQLESYNELLGKLQNEMNLRKKAVSSAASAEEKATVLEGKLTQLSQSIEREKKRLHNELAQLKGESKLSVSRISVDLERMEFRANNAEKESELFKEQREDLKKQFNECLHQKSDVEKKLSSFTFQEVNSTESNILVKHLQEELRNYESEVREARKLKSSHEDIELLKEKLLEEKGRRERAESELSKLLEQQIILNNLENELSSWKLMMKDIPGVSCLEDILVKFATLKKLESSRVSESLFYAMIFFHEIICLFSSVLVQLKGSELQKTKEKLQALEELKSQSGDTGKLVDSYIPEKIMKLKEQIATLEKREERYKTVFADRISVFRRACCELFGYKIVMDDHQRPNGIPVTHFTLQSIYAQSDDEKLEFEYESGNTNILVGIFVRKLNSIPAFTANLTVESFNRRTLS